ncbi:hypothetical protein C8A00DRAFT_17542, partial [Chaetomidium leptoderma]
AAKLPLHEILHLLRGRVEWYHRHQILRQSVRFPGPMPVSLESIGGMRMSTIESCCNKSVPIYVLPDGSCSVEAWRLLLAVLHNYLYRTWFQPYRSEIDWGQFLAEIINVREDAVPVHIEKPAEVARFAALMSRAICTHVETTQQKIGSRAVTSSDEMHALRKELGLSDWETISQQKFLLLRPLFRAVAIVIKRNAYGLAVPEISQIPVLVVLTGVEEGLSAPITFASIASKISAHHTEDSVQTAETSLATAVNFVMDLEKRELDASGPIPDPAETCKDPRRSCLLGKQEAWAFARVRGWEGVDAPEGPSSSWVDHNIYREWTAEGSDHGEAVAQGWEDRCRKRVIDGY